MHYDAVATGQVIVLGQLYINYQHPNYLSRVLYDYFQIKDLGSFRTAGEGNSFSPTVGLYTQPVAGDYPAPTASGLRGQRGAFSRQEATYDQILDSLHSDPSLAANFGAAFSGGGAISNRTVVSGTGGLHDLIELSANEGESLDLAQNLSRGGRRDAGAIYARPDHFTNNEGLADPINIVVTYGDPSLNGESAGIMSYMPSSSIILRGVHFIGEAQQVMSDDQPIMETYKFIARKKETLLARGQNSGD
jgi:hypothetical protein